MDYNNLLKNYREQINSLDRELIYLLSRRFEIVNQIWIIKKENNISALQEWRWNELLSENLEIAKEFWVSKNVIIDIWNRIHKESLNIEK